ncbi:MAG TPA: class I SAM-dependent rRNA methyltransferase [Melioribacteraceae bacterium]|nr:class I SAM-dependent rRNA methyltransferase [Melioribacteraceae bacterium]
MNRLILKKKEEIRIKHGHLWVFSNEVERIENDGSTIENGDLISISDHKGNYIASGFYNTNSLITARILTNKVEFDLNSLFEEKLSAAFELRRRIYPERNSFRMVFSESDYLPGLIIDKYNNSFVLQIYSSGMEKRTELIIRILKEKYDAVNIFSRNEEYFRKLECLPEEDKVYSGSRTDEIIDDGFVKYKIDFNSSQKTGFYFDQCDNREFVGRFCKDKSVLDCFCNSGGFGLHAALNGAGSVTFVDSSSQELKNASGNFVLNGFNSESQFIDSDVFDYLEKCISQNLKFDAVIIDPPAFAKNKKSLPKAIKGYEKLNRLAMQIVTPGGFLFTSSCSYHLKDSQFLEILNSASVKSGREVQQFYYNNASKDHPKNPAMEETSYLKFSALSVL